MSEEVANEIECQITKTRLSIMKEFKLHMRNFYISSICMLFCLVLGFHIGVSQTGNTQKTVSAMVVKIDLIIDHLGLKNDG